LVLVAVVAVAAVAIRWGPALKEHANVLRDQRRCMNYRAPGGSVMLQADRNEQGVLIGLMSYTPVCWRRFQRPSIAPAVVFLHARTSPSGKRRLVSVEAAPSLAYRPAWSARVLVPDALRGPADVPGSPYYPDLPGADRIYAGQPDPADPSHFTVEYENGGERKTADGWLQDDDTLKFSVREPAQ
jgi:hypothetical protein